MNISVFRDARTAYLNHLQAGGVELAVRPGGFRKRQEGDVRGRSSELDLCPLRSANEARGVEPSHPDQVYANQPDKLHLFRSGHTTANEWEATLRWYGAQHGWRIESEVPVDDSMSIGTADMIITLPEGTTVVVEFKRTDQRALRERATGKLHGWNHFLQLADYVGKVSAEYNHDRRVVGALVRDHRSYYKVYRVQSTLGGYDILSEEGELLDYIHAREEIVDRLITAKAYHQGALADVPYSNPLEHWQCTGSKSGNTYQVGCPFFGNCWKISAAEITVVDGKIWNDEGECYYTGKSNG